MSLSWYLLEPSANDMVEVIAFWNLYGRTHGYQLVPTVSNVGETNGYVPKRYHFKTLEEATEMISLHFVSNEERIEISRIINDFQICNYIKSFQKLVQELL
jgi:adenine C2-methylase RlmN of 23S rRNA A2503 and tRNA A37